ncbi:MAG TPA: hypothetical protein VJK26_00135 [Patescibacteria group bacterium]|nr:hypothetical protein [Patescibacteria group bacterium]
MDPLEIRDQSMRKAVGRFYDDAKKVIFIVRPEDPVIAEKQKEGGWIFYQALTEFGFSASKSVWLKVVPLLWYDQRQIQTLYGLFSTAPEEIKVVVVVDDPSCWTEKIHYDAARGMMDNLLYR